MANYPDNLVEPIKIAWKAQKIFNGEKLAALPSDPQLIELLTITYHTSLLREEGRKLKFRVLVLKRARKKGTATNPISLGADSRIAEFPEPRTLSIAELRRLAPAADSTRSMICVEFERSEGWKIWALIDTGANWWDFTRHEARSGRMPPRELTISSHAPGELIVSSAGTVLLSLRGGSIYNTTPNVLTQGILGRHLEPGRRALYKACIQSLRDKKFDHSGHDNDYPKRFFDMCLSRVINQIKELEHGGTLILVPDELEANDSRLNDRLIIKHQCIYNYAWELMTKHLALHRKYYDLYFPLWNSETSIAPDDFQNVSVLDMRREENEEALRDCFRFIASLSSVDGALVMTDKFRILGFGAEVIAQSPTLKHISISADPHAKQIKSISVEAYGTRHRSAFRFCSSYEEAIAFIVSSDGGIKATKRVGSDIILWPELDTAA